MQGIIDLHHDIFFFLLCLTFFFICFMESSGQKRGRAQGYPNSYDPRKKRGWIEIPLC